MYKKMKKIIEEKECFDNDILQLKCFVIHLHVVYLSEIGNVQENCKCNRKEREKVAHWAHLWSTVQYRNLKYTIIVYKKVACFLGVLNYLQGCLWWWKIQEQEHEVLNIVYRRSWEQHPTDLDKLPGIRDWFSVSNSTCAAPLYIYLFL